MDFDVWSIQLSRFVHGLRRREYLVELFVHGLRRKKYLVESFMNGLRRRKYLVELFVHQWTSMQKYPCS